MSENVFDRLRTCFLCGTTKQRVLLPAPKPEDSNYVVAVCPDCDMTSGNRTEWRKL